MVGTPPAGGALPGAPLFRLLARVSHLRCPVVHMNISLVCGAQCVRLPSPPSPLQCASDQRCSLPSCGSVSGGALPLLDAPFTGTGATLWPPHDPPISVEGGFIVKGVWGDVVEAVKELGMCRGSAFAAMGYG